MSLPSSSPMMIKFCPYCGGSLEKSGALSFKFCPFCGGLLSPGSADNTLPVAQSVTLTDTIAQNTSPILPIDYSLYEQVSSMDDVITNYERFIKDQQNAGLPENEIRPFAAELMRRLKSKIPLKVKSLPINERKKTPVISQQTIPARKITTELVNEASYYTIVLKACSRRENLARRLGSILLRGYFAIRLAIDNMPCIIVYKGKISELPSHLPVFYEEGAAITVIAGDFESHIDIPAYFSHLTLSDSMLSILQKVPYQLWLGDRPYAAANAQALEREGLLIVTDQAIYFIYLVGNTYEWFVLSYHYVKNLIPIISSTENSLQIVGETSDHSSPALMKTDFSSETELHTIQLAIEKALVDRHFHTIMHEQCSHCSFAQKNRCKYCHE